MLSNTFTARKCINSLMVCKEHASFEVGNTTFLSALTIPTFINYLLAPSLHKTIITLHDPPINGLWPFFSTCRRPCSVLWEVHYSFILESSPWTLMIIQNSDPLQEMPLVVCLLLPAFCWSLICWPLLWLSGHIEQQLKHLFLPKKCAKMYCCQLKRAKTTLCGDE